MLSVLKNTKTPVKFWFLKNYLSPTFKVCFSGGRRRFLLRRYEWNNILFTASMLFV